MKLAVFWKLNAALSREAERQLVGEMLSTLPQAALGVEFCLWLGPRDGLTVVETDEITTTWKALDPYVGRVDFKIRPAVYYDDVDALLRRRQELLAQAEEWFERLPPELREPSVARDDASGSETRVD